MRTVTPPLQAKLNQKLGTEPILLVEIEWVEGSPIMYSDQKIDGADYPYPIILEMGGFDTSMMLSGASDSLTLNLTLDDIDGHLKDIYLNNDVHKRPAKVYLTYKGLNLTDKTLLFKGEIVTPFEWDEGKRSLSFTLLSKLEETEAGFSMEEGDFPNIPEEALGKAWPLVFGQVCHVPAVQIRASRRGYLLAGEGILESARRRKSNARQPTLGHTRPGRRGPTMTGVMRKYYRLALHRNVSTVALVRSVN